VKKFKIRRAEAKDDKEMIAIWKAGAVKAGVPLAIEDIYDVEEFFLGRLKGQTEIFQIWVAESEGGEILGWQSLSACTNNPVTRGFMAESSTYVRPEAARQGVGKALLLHAMNHAQQKGLRLLQGYISLGNTASAELVKRLGWQHAYTLPVGLLKDAPDFSLFTYVTG
jgi:L-amino acid N-acyltransferase YncA